MILSDWQEQYERMRRSKRRLERIATGREDAGSDDARDALVHFFQDAYHLKDWIKNDDEVPTDVDPEDAIENSDALRLCADLANGTKHLKLQRTRTGDLETGFMGQGVTVRPSPVGSGEPGRPPLHSWRVASDGQTHDALQLAQNVIAAWDEWLNGKGLIRD